MPWPSDSCLFCAFGLGSFCLLRYMTYAYRIVLLLILYISIMPGIAIAQEWAWATVGELQAALNSGAVTSHELTEYFLDRTATYNPKLAAVIELNPEALSEAQALDQERQASGPRSALHGIPIWLKDNVNTRGPLHTSGCTLALAEAVAHEDAALVKRLRQAGAVILGKTTMTELANFMTADMPAGYSSRCGQGKNPYGPGRLSPGGSSSGSAIAVAAGLAPLAIGTETSGSIISPASQNLVVGIKPTLGLVDMSGVMPIAPSQDTAGPLARNVSDAALALSALTDRNYLANLNLAGAKDKRIGFDPSLLESLKPWQQELVWEAMRALRKAGAIFFYIEVPTLPEVRARTSSVLVYEFAPAFDAYLQGLDSEIKSLAELVEYNQAHSEAIRFGQTLLDEALASQGESGQQAYERDREADLELAKVAGLDAAFKTYRLDAILFPKNLGAAIGAKAGYPSVAVPAGRGPDGEPMGVAFLGQAYQEAKLLGIAYAFEQTCRVWVAPAGF